MFEGLDKDVDRFWSGQLRPSWPSGLEFVLGIRCRGGTFGLPKSAVELRHEKKLHAGRPGAFWLGVFGDSQALRPKPHRKPEAL